MQSSVHWLENVAFEAKTQSGHTIIMDGSPEYGGENRGARPMELILTGLGGCASFDIVTILKKAHTIPAVFTKIHLHFVITGNGVKEKQVSKAIELSAEKYCSASKMLMDGGVEITHDFEILEAETV